MFPSFLGNFICFVSSYCLVHCSSSFVKMLLSGQMKQRYGYVSFGNLPEISSRMNIRPIPNCGVKAIPTIDATPHRSPSLYSTYLSSRLIVPTLSVSRSCQQHSCEGCRYHQQRSMARSTLHDRRSECDSE